MEIVHSLGREAVLKALSIEPPNPATVDRFLERYVRGEIPHATKETTPFFFALRSHYLRNFVDSWLETGLRDDGSESPFERDLFRASTIWLAASDHLDKYPPQTTLSAISHDVTITFGDFARDGTGPTNPFEGAHFDALRHFVEIFSSDWKECLCKCRHRSCGRYFLLKKPRRKYQRGTFCSPKHQRLASATVVVKNGRIRLKKELIEIAARWLFRKGAVGARLQEDKTLRVQLAACLRRSRRCRAFGLMIQSNWVSRHYREIEEKRIELARK